MVRKKNHEKINFNSTFNGEKKSGKDNFYLQHEAGLFFQLSSAAFESNLKTHFKAFSFQQLKERLQKKRYYVGKNSQVGRPLPQYGNFFD